MLLVLLVVGTASPAFINVHKKLTGYTESDYTALVNILSYADAIFITPNTLTETSNLSDYIREPARSTIRTVLKNIINTNHDDYIPSIDATRNNYFKRLGLTDSVSLIHAANTHSTILTADLSLYLAALETGIKAINFNHIRDSYL